MEDSSQWVIGLLIGIPIAVFLAWFNKSGSDFKDGFAKKTKKNKKWIIIDQKEKGKFYLMN